MKTTQDSVHLPTELSDADVLEAMRRIPGYLDISAQDFREIYRLARLHAFERLFSGISSSDLMQIGIVPVRPNEMLDTAARRMTQQGIKAIPVTDTRHRVIGILTESDFLRRLQAPDFLSLMLDLIEDPAAFTHRCHETPVSAVMSSPPHCIPVNAGFSDITRAFRQCDGRCLPVIDAGNRLRGLLWRKAFFAAIYEIPTQTESGQ